MTEKYERTVLDMNTSMAMTLPAPWVRFYGIKPGDKLTVIVDKDIVISQRKD